MFILNYLPTLKRLLPQPNTRPLFSLFKSYTLDFNI